MSGDLLRCDPSQLFGAWMIEPSYLTRYVGLAKGADLAQLRAESQAAAAASRPGPRYQLVGVPGASEGEGIAVIDLSGPLTKHPTTFQALIGGTSMIAARAALREASRAPDVLGIMLRVDSPGGTVAGGAELAADIRRAAALKPLHAYADDLAASGALLALAQGGKVWAGPNAQVGSIGVYTVVEDTSQQYLQDGVKVYVVSSAPPLKGAGVDGTEISAPMLAEWQRRVADLADWFVGEVATGRRMPRAAVEKLATGQTWISSKAQALGLVDAVMTFDEAMARLGADVEQDLDRWVSETATRLAMAQQPKAAPPPPAPRPAPVPPKPLTARELAAELEAAARDRRLTLVEYARTAEGRAAYTEYRETMLREGAA